MKQEAARTRQLFGAFAAGGIGLLVIFAVSLKLSRLGGKAQTDNERNVPRSSLYMPVDVEEE
jgi:hypothetical protein